MKKLLFLFYPLFLFSCEKDIDIDLDSTSKKIVVDASIENGQPPTVFLSRSYDYFSRINPSILASSFIRNAEVYMSNGTKKHRLREDSIPNVQGYTIFYYTLDPSDPSTAFLGELNTSYDLEIKVDGNTYTATTMIPPITRRIDSIWWDSLPIFEPEDSNRAKLFVKATDKPGLGDYIRYYTKTNREPFFPGLNSVFDDQIIDGTTYVLPIEKGLNKNVEFEEDNAFFNRGDTVVIKLSNIDKATYDFWRTFEFSFQSIGNPFSSPTRILTNINGNALGYFGGYASQYRSIIIPPR